MPIFQTAYTLLVGCQLSNRHILNAVEEEDVLMTVQEVETTTVHSEQVVAMPTAVPEDGHAVKLNLLDYLLDDPAVANAIQAKLPPMCATGLLEASIFEQQIINYTFCNTNKIVMPNNTFILWKHFKDIIAAEDRRHVNNVTSDEAGISDNVLLDLHLDISVDLVAEVINVLTDMQQHGEISAPVVKSTTHLDAEELYLSENSQQHGGIEAQVIKAVTIVNMANTAKFPFNNTSYPGDPDSDILPHRENNIEHK